MSGSARYLSVALAMALIPLLGVTTAEAATYYVAVTGNDAADGQTPDTAWRTVTYSATKAVAGDTVNIKAGLYQGEQVYVKNSGTEGAPIVFRGYSTQPGDAPDPKYEPGKALDATVLPVLQGASTDQTKDIGFEIGNKTYIEVRNLGVTQYNFGVFPYSSDHVTIENVYAVSIGPTGPDGNAGLIFRSCTNSTLRNSVSTDSWDVNVFIWKSTDCVVENVKSYAVAYDPPGAATDYHIVVADSQGVVVRNCRAENLHTQIESSHPGHGIGVKDQAGTTGYPNPHSERNQFIDCTAVNTYESFFVAHEAHHNEFVGCSAFADHALQSRAYAGIILRDGAHDNTFSEFYSEGPRSGVILQETVEGPDGANQIVKNNLITNSVFVDSVKGIEIWNADDNAFTNCVFDSVGSWMLVRFPFERVGSGNSCRNSIVTNNTGELFVADLGSQEVFPFTYTDFWQNNFAMPAGEGNQAQDPLFADSAKRDYHLKSQHGRWDSNVSAWVEDAETSPCIDQGNPSDDYSAERCPNGARINLGAYGNTLEASKSPSNTPCVDVPLEQLGGRSATGNSGTGSTGPRASNDQGCGCRAASGGGGPVMALLVGAGTLSLRRLRRKRPPGR